MLPDLRRAGRSKRMALSGLAEDDVAAMVAAAARRTLDADEMDFAHHLHAETGGHPFCVEEVLLHFAETGALLREGGRWASTKARHELGIPDGVREIIGQRLSRLPETAREVLARAAVIGHQFDVQVLAAIVDGGMRVVVEALEAAEPARLISPGPGHGERYRFGHSLVRSCIYEDMPTSRRRWLHRSVGLALERQHAGNGERLNELAIHFGEAAAVGEADRAVRYAREAGDQAAARLAFEQAAAHYGRALSALELSVNRDPVLTCDLQLARARALYGAGSDHFRTVVFAAADTARALGDAERLASAALLFIHFGPVNSVVSQRELALMEEALERLDHADSPERARLLAGLGGVFTRQRSQPAVAISRQAVEMARRLDDPMVLASVLASHHAAIAGPDATDEWLAVARELVTLGEEIDDPETRFAGHISCYASFVAAGDIEAADASLDAGNVIARELRQPIFAFHILRLRTAQALLAGRVAEGEQLAAAMRQKGEETSIPATTLDVMVTGFRFLAGEQQGSLANLEPEVSRLVAAQPDWLLMQVVQAHVRCAAGRTTAARALLDRLKADGFNVITRDELWFETLMHLAAIAHGLSDVDAAGMLYGLLLPYAGRNTFTGMGPFGPVDRALAPLAATIGRFTDAERHFEAALGICRRLRAPGWAAVVRYGWAKMLRTPGRPDDQDRRHELAVVALADAQRLGLTGLAEELTDLTGP
jgi:hypothetical protein